MVTRPYPTTVDEQIGQNVRIELAKQRWSVNRAAAELGWKQSYLSRRVNGDHSFSVSELFRLARFLDRDIAVFFDGVDTVSPAVPPTTPVMLRYQGSSRHSGRLAQISA